MTTHPLEMPDCDERNEYLWRHWGTRCRTARYDLAEAIRCFEKSQYYLGRISPARVAEMDNERLERVRSEA